MESTEVCVSYQKNRELHCGPWAVHSGVLFSHKEQSYAAWKTKKVVLRNDHIKQIKTQTNVSWFLLLVDSGFYRFMKSYMYVCHEENGKKNWNQVWKTCISHSLRHCLHQSRCDNNLNAHEWMSIWRIYGLITHHYQRVKLLFIPLSQWLRP